MSTIICSIYLIVIEENLKVVSKWFKKNNHRIEKKTVTEFSKINPADFKLNR